MPTTTDATTTPCTTHREPVRVPLLTRGGCSAPLQTGWGSALHRDEFRDLEGVEGGIYAHVPIADEPRQPPTVGRVGVLPHAFDALGSRPAVGSESGTEAGFAAAVPADPVHAVIAGQPHRRTAAPVRPPAVCSPPTRTRSRAVTLCTAA